MKLTEILCRGASKLALSLAVILFMASPGWSNSIVGSIFLTGHDPDFHAVEGPNGSGAANIIKDAMGFVMDPAFNPFVAGGNTKFLYVESNIPVPGGHVNGDSGLNAAGFTNFDEADASTLATALGQLGTTYSAVVVASDFGADLTQAELNILNSNSATIINFLNQGGGVFAMAESGTTGLTTSGFFGFLPFVISSTTFNQAESGNTVTPFGASLGLTNGDVNGNFSHNIFTSTGGLSVVDTDQFGDILSVAGRGLVTPGGVVPGPSTVPEPGTIFLLGSGLAGIIVYQRRKIA